MRDREQRARILGSEAPLSVTDVELDDAEQLVNVWVKYDGELKCPSAGRRRQATTKSAGGGGTLGTCQYRT